MMELTRIVAVQWHLLGRADLAFRGDTAILGRNRAGKSTLIDLIQTVMTGGAASLYRYNSSAGDGSKRRSDRTLKGYVLGELGDQSRQRDMGTTHIGLVFEDPTGARAPISLGLCIEARANEDARVVGHYILPGVPLTSDMLVVADGAGGLRSANWPEARSALEAEAAQVGGSLVRADTARGFIREYMRLLFTGRRTPDPERFAKAFVVALSFEDMGSFESFVHHHLIERRDIDIGELRESIQRYRQIQQIIQDMEERLAALRAMSLLVNRFADALAREDVARAVSRLAAMIDAGSALMGNLARRRALKAQIATGEAERVRQAEELEYLANEMASITAQMNADGAASQRHGLEAEMRGIEKQRGVVLAAIQARYLMAGRGEAILALRERLAPLKCGELLAALDAVQAQSQGVAPPQWPRDARAMDQLLARAGAEAGKRIDKARDERDRAIAFRNDFRNGLTELEGQRRAAADGNVRLDTATDELMEILRREGMAPRALCQVVDMKDEEWRQAAEALLGRDREAILVDPEHAEQAIAILRAGRARYRSCRIANSRRLMERARPVEPDTLAAVMITDDPLARAFLSFRAGTIRLARSEHDLLSGGRAIMADGTYNNGIIVELLQARDMKIGRAAAPLMLGLLDEQIAAQRALLDTHDQNARFYDDLLKRLSDLAHISADAVSLESLSIDYDRIGEEQAALRARIDRISIQVDPQLAKALDMARVQRKNLAQDAEQLIEELGGARRELAQVQQLIDGGDQLPGSLMALASRRARFREKTVNLSQFAIVRQSYQAARDQGGPRAIAQAQAREADAAFQQHTQLGGDIRDALTQYRMDFKQSAPVAHPGRILGEVRPWLEEGIAALADNDLIQYRSQADEAAETIDRLFRTTFIHELNSRFAALDDELEAINAALRTRPLHNEVYTIKSRIKDAFRGLYDLARDSERDEGTLNLLFSDRPLAENRHDAALREVEKLFKDEDVDFSVYEDFRNFFHFELRMTDKNSGREFSYDKRRGTASGAERQVPFYVIIGAALSSIYHGAGRKGQAADRGIGLAMFDEAFSKMDGPNQRTLLQFYDDIGLQVVIAAPTEKRAIVYENLDSIIDMFRTGEHVTARVAHIREQARQAMREANPDHMSEATLLDHMQRSEMLS
ncbi:SbcC/MukB-like Walker B domain-containing protein [Sphingobium yanoikuyae]|uniref:SbcC/MukB-like Walker B domain-containing protein n=1 Tax=Sphingobium yanoikuyae TaxID=13690 RepID=UPI0028A97FA9|nr:SbcC/MukB-like Walker B domain-containing protein [Sphingobium yanoikuyae]